MKEECKALGGMNGRGGTREWGNDKKKKRWRDCYEKAPFFFPVKSQAGVTRDCENIWLSVK